VGLFRRRHKRRPGRGGKADPADVAHLEQFAHTRVGVEAFVEPPTTVTETTVVLVAQSGEWTRRRVGSADSARSLGRRLAIPVYDVAATGYPQRMRQWTAQRKASGETGVPGLEGPSV
jgi:hypothetical protein